MVLLLGPGKAGIGGRGFVVEASSVADAEYGSQGRAKRAPGIYAKSAGALKERQKRIVLSHFQCSILNCCDPGASCSHRSHLDRKSTRLNSSHSQISYAVFCLKKK